MKALRAAIAALTATLAIAVPAHAGPQATITGTFADEVPRFVPHLGSGLAPAAPPRTH